MVSVCATKPSWNAFSVSVSVSASEFLKSPSIVRLTSAARLPSAICTTKTPAYSARLGNFFFICSFK